MPQDAYRRQTNLDDYNPPAGGGSPSSDLNIVTISREGFLDLLARLKTIEEKLDILNSSLDGVTIELEYYKKLEKL